MNDFRARKAARIAAGGINRKFKFNVVEARYDGKVVGTFSNKRDAESFANEQLSSWVGDTAAYRAWQAMQPRLSVTPNTHFCVVREEIV